MRSAACWPGPVPRPTTTSTTASTSTRPPACTTCAPATTTPRSDGSSPPTRSPAIPRLRPHGTGICTPAEIRSTGRIPPAASSLPVWKPPAGSCRVRCRPSGRRSCERRSGRRPKPAPNRSRGRCWSRWPSGLRLASVSRRCGTRSRESSTTSSRPGPRTVACGASRLRSRSRSLRSSGRSKRSHRQQWAADWEESPRPGPWSPGDRRRRQVAIVAKILDGPQLQLLLEVLEELKEKYCKDLPDPDLP